MPLFSLKESKRQSSSCACLSSIGQCCETAYVEQIFAREMPPSAGSTTTGELFKTMVGLITPGTEVFWAIEPFCNNRQAPPIDKVPSSAWRRQRLDARSRLRVPAAKASLRRPEPDQAPIGAYQDNESWNSGPKRRPGKQHSVVANDDVQECVSPRTACSVTADAVEAVCDELSFDNTGLRFPNADEQDPLSNVASGTSQNGIRAAKHRLKTVVRNVTYRPAHYIAKARPKFRDYGAGARHIGPGCSTGEKRLTMP